MYKAAHIFTSLTLLVCTLWTPNLWSMELVVEALDLQEPDMKIHALDYDDFGSEINGYITYRVYAQLGPDEYSVKGVWGGPSLESDNQYISTYGKPIWPENLEADDYFVNFPPYLYTFTSDAWHYRTLFSIKNQNFVFSSFNHFLDPSNEWDLQNGNLNFGQAGLSGWWIEEFAWDFTNYGEKVVIAQITTTSRRIKGNLCVEYTSATQGQQTTCDDFSTSVPVKSDIQIFPNPSNGIFNININNPGEKEVLIEVYGQTGALVLTRQLHSQAPIIQESFDISKLPSGNYIAYIKTDTQTFQKRLTKI